MCGALTPTPSLEELTQAFNDLNLSHKKLRKRVEQTVSVAENSRKKIDKVVTEDREIKESQRKLMKMPLPPRFKGKSSETESWLIQL